ncbi:MAG: 7-carboxy-7-deazaguanine synthase [Planctomycetaceae bacterium]
MSYVVKSIYYTLQGEGANTGRPAVFCRFAGCNLWSGREEDRAAAICSFCDTDFVGTDGPGGGRFETAAELAAAVARVWRKETQHSAPSTQHSSFLPLSSPLVVCTGGEPLLQLDQAAVDALRAASFQVAVETNGTRLPPDGIDWICVSPKAGAQCVLRRGDELKLVVPQEGMDPAEFADWPFRHFFLQPMDGPELDRNTRLAARYCLEHPQWRLGLQMHKLVGLP